LAGTIHSFGLAFADRLPVARGSSPCRLSQAATVAAPGPLEVAPVGFRDSTREAVAHSAEAATSVGSWPRPWLSATAPHDLAIRPRTEARSLDVPADGRNTAQPSASFGSARGFGSTGSASLTARLTFATWSK